MKVLIADDSAVIVERLADLLKEIPAVELVGKAATVSEAIDSIRAMNPDAVILDLQMPGGTGLDVLRAVRPDHPSLQIVICTNYPYPRYRQECLTAGANFFIDKSTEFEKIPVIFRELIRDASKIAPASLKGASSRIPRLHQ